MSEWQPILTRPKDQTVIVTVVPSSSNLTFRKWGATVHPAYIDAEGNICDSSTWDPDTGLNGDSWIATHWMPLPEPAK